MLNLQSALLWFLKCFITVVLSSCSGKLYNYYPFLADGCTGKQDLADKVWLQENLTLAENSIFLFSHRNTKADQGMIIIQQAHSEQQFSHSSSDDLSAWEVWYFLLAYL